MAKLFFGSYLNTLQTYIEPKRTDLQLGTCLLAAGIAKNYLVGKEFGEGALDHVNKDAISKYCSGDRDIPNKILVHYQTPVILDGVIPYFEKEITDFIDKSRRTADLFRDFSDLIFSDGDIAYDQKKSFEQLAKPETLNDFLSEVFIYAIKQKSKPQREIKFPFKHIPFEKNVFFTGRDDKIKEIHDNFHNGIRMQTISGMSATGKTQIALEYAHYFAGEYDVFWWIDAENSATMHSALKLFLARKNCLPDTDNAEVESGAFLDWFDTHDSWLLIYDNALYATDEEYKTFQKYLPKNSDIGNILITTTCNTAYASEPLINIEIFAKPVAVDFLQRRTKNYDSKKATAIAERLGYLPLALEQAGAFIAEKLNGDYEGYLKLLRKYATDTLDQTDKARNYKYTVTETLRITLDKIQKPSAIEIMNICAYLSPDCIDTAFFYLYACEVKDNLLSQTTSDDIANELKLSRIIDDLTKYSLCVCEPAVFRFDTRHTNYKHFRGVKRLHFHRLVHEIIRERLGNDLHYLYVCIDMLYKVQRISGIFDRKRDFSPNCLLMLEHIDRLNPAIKDNTLFLKLAKLSAEATREDAASSFRIDEKWIYFTERFYGREHIETANAMFSCVPSHVQIYKEQCLRYIDEAVEIFEKHQSKELGSAYYTATTICYVAGDLDRMTKYYEKIEKLCSQDPAKCGFSNEVIIDLADDLEALKEHKKSRRS
jgi:hypothetical protein